MNHPLYPTLRRELVDAIMGPVPADRHNKVLYTAHPDMVTELAKPGQAIVDSMTPQKFGTLGQALGFVIGASEGLDRVKKLVIYNKPIVGVELKGEYPTLTFDADKAHLLHMAVGVVGEAGELADAIAAHAFENAELDVENVKEELGDLLFYIQGVLTGVGSSLEEVLLRNKAKLLGLRYKDGYSDKAAQERADKPAGE